jgi:3-hydroxymyristoyl/3-hydroxydecanoyl-(acyl carrier protein) dehydratase
VSEAIGQLASWLCLERNGFSARPVFLFADRIEVLASVRPGEAVLLEASLHEMDAESLRFSGRALVQGRVVQTVKDCSGYFMPLAELEDPAVTRARFQTLTAGVLALEGAGGPPYPLADLAGETLSLEPFARVQTRTRFAPEAPFYADHFPRFPVTPIVILNEMIGQATAKVAGLNSAQERGALQIRRIEDVKIRTFVRPGETCETIVTVTALREEGPVKLLAATAEIKKDGKRILRGNYTYELLYG